MTSKHTPAPWAINESETDEGCWEIGTGEWRGDSYEGLQIATAWGFYHEAEANARLIAAAPELVEALREVIGWHDDADNLHKPIEVRAAYMRARALLAEIDGE